MWLKQDPALGLIRDGLSLYKYSKFRFDLVQCHSPKDAPLRTPQEQHRKPAFNCGCFLGMGHYILSTGIHH